MKVRCIEETQGLSLGAGKLILYKGEEFDVVQKIKDTESGESLYILTDKARRFVADVEYFEVIHETNI